MSSKLNTEVSIKLVREIFQEMFQKQQKDILALISANLKLANDRIDGLLTEINTLKNSCEVLKKENENRNTDLKKTNKQMIKYEKIQKDIEESLTFYQDCHDKKVSDLEKKLINDKKVSDVEKKMSSNATIGENEKNRFRQLEDRQRRNNLRIEGVKENDNENWDDTEVKIINLLENNLNVKDVIIERAHRTGIIDIKKPRTIVIKLLNYKDKVKILKNANKLKGSGIYINEDFSLETTIIRKKLLEESKTHRINGKYSVVIYDKLIVKEFRKKNHVK
ncbi:putative leucine-rich repeat-containing protein DDB_G0290503 [Hydra vulgaris]|uniref:Leucine-rich repeat-containing protein DDB_G0290503 n=1 Tax=Hydra vulgaris TaxID=6087 RepID=A0ABM4CUV0_HYDVU